MKKGKTEPRKDAPSKAPTPAPSTEPGAGSEHVLAVCEQVSSERYQAFVENIEEGVYEVDTQGHYLYFNDALCKILGYPREEIQYQSFEKFMDPEEARRAQETFGRIYQTGQGISDLLWKIRDHAGDLRTIELSANLITDEEGRKIGFRGIARDITDKFKTQKALKQSERRLRTLLRFLPYPFVVFTLDGRVSYLNPAFTETFGWTLKELEGKPIPYVPPGLEQETTEHIRRLFEQKVIKRQETQRLTKDGRVLDVKFRAAVFSEDGEEPSGELVILQNITREKRIARNNEAMLKISLALPEYPDLEGLLDYISGEVKRLLGTEGALVILLDEEKNELFFKSAVLEDSVTEKRMKEIRYPANKGISGAVIRTGEPIMVPDTSKDPNFYSVVDMQSGFRTRDMLDVPLRSKDRIIGVLSAMNKKAGAFDQTDMELLNMVAGTVALYIENARFSEELRHAYNEVTSLNRAKDKVINHLSHELKTPLAILSASLNSMTKRLASLPEDSWRPSVERAKRSLDRILQMQYQVEDIMQEKGYRAHWMLTTLLDECADELEALVADVVGEGPVVEKIRSRIEEAFGPRVSLLEDILLHQFVPATIDEIRPLFSHRELTLTTQFEPAPAVRIPSDALKKVVVGLIKNAVENTPDEGEIEITVRKRGSGAELVVHDYGVGIAEENQQRIFEGFFTTQDTMDYSSKRPFDFNAGGKGADLLRMKIFSERYDFKIDMTSARCPHIPRDKDLCPGRISQCPHCKEREDCHRSGGTTFRIFFPSAMENGGEGRQALPESNSKG